MHKRTFYVLSTLFCLFFSGIITNAQISNPSNLPDSIFVGDQRNHVQGIVYDKEANCMYFSFTDRFLKIDMQGKLIASIERIQGHLGDMTFDPVQRKVYASLECKDDEIGRGISKSLNVKQVSRQDTRFYIAIIDVDKLQGIAVSPEKNEVFKTVCLHKVVDDYKYQSQGQVGFSHRYGCSGIDGVTLAPAVSSKRLKSHYSKQCKKNKQYLYVAYGIYGDTSRQDNDYQVVHVYDPSKLERYAQEVIFGEHHSIGPRKPQIEYFIYTGNTTYGVQNMSYDPHTDCIYMAAYAGKKIEFPNYTLFAFSLNQKPWKGTLIGGTDSKNYTQLSLVQGHPHSLVNPKIDQNSGVSGWHFRWGTTGMFPLGDGLWYISEDKRDNISRLHSCTARLYKWIGTENNPFEKK